MTVAELLELLKDVEPSTIIVMSSDGEGNSYSPLAGVNADSYLYQADSTWSGELHEIDELIAEIAEDDEPCDDHCVYDISDYGVPCVVVWPTN